MSMPIKEHEAPRLDEHEAPELDAALPSTAAAPIDRRSFMMRSAMIGAVAVLSGSAPASAKETAERAALAGIIGKEPATINPLFLDELAAKPDQQFPVTLGGATFQAPLKDIVYHAPKGDFPHPNTMRCKLMGSDTVLLELEYYSVGGGFIEWKGYQPPKKGQPKYPYATMKELQAHAEKSKLTFAQVAMANEVAVSGKTHV